MDQKEKKVTEGAEPDHSELFNAEQQVETSPDATKKMDVSTESEADAKEAEVSDTDEAPATADQLEEGSTIFLKNPKQEQIKSSDAKKRRGKTLVILLAVLFLTVISVLYVIYKMPNFNNAANSQDSLTVPIKTNLAYDLAKLVIKNSYGTYSLVSTVGASTTSDGTPNVKWSLPGYDSSLIADSSISATADQAATLSALRKMEDESADYGLDKPTITVAVTGRNKVSDYTITVGKQSPDKSGSYVSVSGVNGVYLVSASVIDSFNIYPEKLANTVIVQTPKKPESGDSSYYDNEGKISSFDTITLSGKRYKNTITIAHSNNTMAEFQLTTPVKRYADNDKTNALFGIMINGLVATDTYKLVPSAADIKSYGFSTPDVIVSFKYGSQTTTVRAVKRTDEEGMYAVMVDGRNGIYKVTTDALNMLDATETDYYNDFVFLETISDFSNIHIDTTGKDYSFDITYDEKKDEIGVKQDGKTLKPEVMQSYYPYFTTLKPQPQDSYVAGTPELTATFTYKDTAKGKAVMTFTKQSTRRYLVTVNGEKMGLINSVVFDNIVKYAANVVTGQAVPDAS